MHSESMAMGRSQRSSTLSSATTLYVDGASEPGLSVRWAVKPRRPSRQTIGRLTSVASTAPRKSGARQAVTRPSPAPTSSRLSNTGPSELRRGGARKQGTGRGGLGGGGGGTWPRGSRAW